MAQAAPARSSEPASTTSTTSGASASSTSSSGSSSSGRAVQLRGMPMEQQVAALDPGRQEGFDAQSARTNPVQREASGAAPTESSPEREAVRAAYLAGTKSIEMLTNLIFFDRHPERVHGAVKDSIKKDEPDLANEWKTLRTTVVRPVVDEELAKAAGGQTTSSPAASGGSGATPEAATAAAGTSSAEATSTPAATPDAGTTSAAGTTSTTTSTPAATPDAGTTSAAGTASTTTTSTPATTPDAGTTSTATPDAGTTSAAGTASTTTAATGGGELGATTAGGATLGGQSSAEIRVGTTMTVVDDNAQRRDAANLRKTTGEVLPKGMKVIVVKGLGTYCQVISAPGESTPLTDADNVWTAGSNLGGVGADVGLGNERANDAGAAAAEGIKASLPSGRNPGKSPYKWKFGGGFATSLNGISLAPTLLQKVTRMLDWAVQNDMLTGDVELGSGMRSPADAHRLCVSWEIQFGKRVSLDALKALPGGKDSDGNFWYQDGWTWDDIKTNANKNASRTADATASEGYAKTDKRRAPVDSTRDVSRHCSGGALDVTVPWRAKGKDASTNAKDVWGWEDIVNQFGLYRAVSTECWHLQETGLALEEDRKPESSPNAGG